MRDSNVLVQIVLSSLSRADIAILSELKRKHPGLSRAALKILFREKRVKLVKEAGSPIRTLGASDDLFPGTHLIEILDWNPSADLSPEPTHGPDTDRLPVLFENDDLLILHKNSGTPSVPLKPFETKTAVSSAIQYLEQSGQVSVLKDFLEIGKSSGHPLEAGLLHRLDTGTSGVLAFAKNQTEFDRIRSLWKTSQVRKFYRAIVQGRVEMMGRTELMGRAESRVGQGDAPIDRSRNALVFKLDHLPLKITTPIGHDPKSSKKMLVIQTLKDERTIRGKPLEAITHILSARSFSQTSLASGSNFSDKLRDSSNQLIDLRIEIETGVMHQIRVHLASIGLPIVGDPLYGETVYRKTGSREAVFGKAIPGETSEEHVNATAPRLHLHHERLELPLRSGTVLSVQAKSDFNAVYSEQGDELVAKEDI